MNKFRKPKYCAPYILYRIVSVLEGGPEKDTEFPFLQELFLDLFGASEYDEEVKEEFRDFIIFQNQPKVKWVDIAVFYHLHAFGSRGVSSNAMTLITKAFADVASPLLARRRAKARTLADEFERAALTIPILHPYFWFIARKVYIECKPWARKIFWWA